MTSSKRLLITTDAVGGVWQYSVELARAVATAGYTPLLALLGPAPTGEQGRELADVGIPFAP
jgi:hypothetical protein